MALFSACYNHSMSNCCKENKDKCCGIGFRSIPAALGDDTGEFKPENGAYHNMLVKYEENGALYFYANDGIWTKLVAGVPSDEPVRLLVGWDGAHYPEGWENVDAGTGARIEFGAGHANITRFQIPNDRLYFEREDTGASLNASQVYGLLESGKKVILDHVPLGAFYPYSASDNTIYAFAYADNVELSNRVYDEGAESTFVSYTGGAYMPCIEADIHTYLGVQIRREVGTQTVSFLVDGRGHFQSN